MRGKNNSGGNSQNPENKIIEEKIIIEEKVRILKGEKNSEFWEKIVRKKKEFRGNRIPRKKKEMRKIILEEKVRILRKKLWRTKEFWEKKFNMYFYFYSFALITALSMLFFQKITFLFLSLCPPWNNWLITKLIDNYWNNWFIPINHFSHIQKYYQQGASHCAWPCEFPLFCLQTDLWFLPGGVSPRREPSGVVLSAPSSGSSAQSLTLECKSETEQRKIPAPAV